MLKKQSPLSTKLAPQQNAIKTIAIIAITVKAKSTGVFMGLKDPNNIRTMLTATVSWQLNLKALTFIFCPLCVYRLLLYPYFGFFKNTKSTQNSKSYSWTGMTA
jgi:hypothetical protein